VKVNNELGMMLWERDMGYFKVFYQHLLERFWRNIIKNLNQNHQLLDQESDPDVPVTKGSLCHKVQLVFLMTINNHCFGAVVRISSDAYIY
jgi:hypothetical protein